MKSRRVAITGMGLVSCFGSDLNSYFSALKEGRSGVALLPDFSSVDYPTRFGAPVRDFETEGYIDKKQARRIDPFIAYTLVAGKKALHHAGLFPDSPIDKKKAGILIGSGIGGLSVFSEAVHTLRDKGLKRMSPFFIPFVITNMGGALLGIDYGYMGPNYSLSTACATGNYAIINAARHIQRGEADIMVAGGVEAPITPIGVAGFSACRALSERNDAPKAASRPWDKGRDGFVIGAGAGVLVLESFESAEKRGVPILAEYLGGAFSCDAHHFTEPREDGAGVIQSIQGAINDAGLKESDIDYINAHATSTKAGDMAEINALKTVFTHPEKIFLNAPKSMTGHAIGAAGGLEAIGTIMQLQEGVVHPTINLTDPEEGLTFQIPLKAVKADIKVGLSNSFGFGGHNASLIFGKV